MDTRFFATATIALALLQPDALLDLLAAASAITLWRGRIRLKRSQAVLRRALFGVAALGDALLASFEVVRRPAYSR